MFFRLVLLSLLNNSKSDKIQVHIVLPFFMIYVIVFVSPSKAHKLSLVSSKKIVILFRKDLVTFLYSLEIEVPNIF